MKNYEGLSPQEIVGKQICTLRKQLKLTQAFLASSAGMKESALQRIEAGRTNPTIKTLYKVSKALNVDIKNLFQNL
ncbi:helix-turn-helix domain-containing protein [Flavobacteriaceae bacterium]|nr:helix-turn-helix domain-containing protein [Flavobacteriaceae bacterium]MDC1460244.1 helix-turn-helix domain-containing protein [Flavobacteriaceae bacterium]